MRAILFLLVFVIFSTSVFAESAYVITLGYSDNTLLFSGIAIKNVPVPQPSLITGYHVIEQRNFGGSITHKSSFQPSAGTFTVATPYYSDTREIIVRDPQQEAVLTIPVLQFADTCNNGICEPQESFETCSQDCPSGREDDYCDEIRDGICDPDCTGTFDGDCRIEQAFQPAVPSVDRIGEKRSSVASQPAPKDTGVTYVLGLIAGLVLIAVVGVGFVLAHTKKLHRIQQMKEYVTQTLAQGYTTEQVYGVLIQNGYNENEVRMVLES